MSYAQTNIELYVQLRDTGIAAWDLERIHRTYLLAAELMSGQYRPSGKSFVAHLVGTASILARHEAPMMIVAAGLGHAVYRHGDFGTGRPSATQAKRSEVRSLLGTEVERWIYAYDSFEWNKETIRRLSAIEIVTEECTLVFMRLANDLEDHLNLGTLYGANAESRHQDATRWSQRKIDLARRIDQTALGAELRAAYDVTAAANLDEFLPLRTSASGVLLLHPRSTWRKPRAAVTSASYESVRNLQRQAARLRRRAKSVISRLAGRK